MTDTTTPAELEIPARALNDGSDACAGFWMQDNPRDVAEAIVSAAAAPIVAAELRRLAPLLADRGSSADLLRARANELDPQQ